MFNIVLHEPEIPANTGNIGRTVLACGAALHLIEPLGFRLTEKMVKRAGMDYWDQVDLHRYRDYEHFLQETGLSGNEDGKDGPPRIWYVTTKADRTYCDVAYQPGDYLMFGKESAGIPEEILARHHAQCVRIPMAPGIRSLNLSNSVAIVLYEALRQQDFKTLEKSGHLHRLKWGDI